jgi:predicted PP-loop superfamily ATPase
MNSSTCVNCINTTENPTITLNSDGLCKTCQEYKDKLDISLLEQEKIFIQSFISDKPYDCMVGISGGKDSAATLYTVKEMGFTPLAFTFDIGYTQADIFSRAQDVADKVGTDFEKIEIKSYINDNDRESYRLMAELYSEEETQELKQKFRDLYQEGRKIYSIKDDVAFPYVRPCQICRKVVIKAYYAEAVKRDIQVVFIGINEWTGLSDNKFTAVRKLQPFANKPAVYIVHLPFLIQRSADDIKPILKKIKWEKPVGDSFIETGASACYLARACEEKAEKMLGFHMDSTRLSREITAGFISKEQAYHALENYKKTDKTVQKVLEEADIL